MPWADIIKSFPKLYLKGMYFECGLGWQKIIYDLSMKIEDILEKTDNNMYAVQVKEKYGILRFYMTEETEEISKLIEDAEALSTQTCESCGEFGKMRQGFPFNVKCDKCFKEHARQ